MSGSVFILQRLEDKFAKTCCKVWNLQASALNAENCAVFDEFLAMFSLLPHLHNYREPGAKTTQRMQINNAISRHNSFARCEYVMHSLLLKAISL